MILSLADFYPKTHDSHSDGIYSSLASSLSFDDNYLRKTLVALTEYCVEYWL